MTLMGVVLDPGSLDVAHQPDEYVPKDDLAARHLHLSRDRRGDDGEA